MPGTRPRSSKREQPPVEVERGVEIADLERHVVDADEPRARHARIVRPSEPGRAARVTGRCQEGTYAPGNQHGRPSPMHRNIRRTLLALGVALIVLPAAISDGHQLTPHQAKVVHHSR